MRFSPRKKSAIILIIITGILIPVFIFITYIIDKEPYFIIIKNNEDLEFWSSSGNGTGDNPYIIEGHHIIVPRNDYEEDYDTPCIPEESIISISGVSKSFVIQNNIFEVKGGCEGQYIIKISDISVPFAIRNNELRGGFYAHAFSLSNINGKDSIVSKNRIYSASTRLNNVHNISFIGNQFYTRGKAYSMSAYQSSNVQFIQNYCFLYSVSFRECSHILIDNNIFENDETYSGWDLLYLREIEYCTITNNTFIRGGLDWRVFTGFYPTAIVFNNIVNGKPYGFFFNQTNVVINTIKYGQILLVKCFETTITEQFIRDVSQPLLIENCIDSTVTNSKFLDCKWVGIDIQYSTNTIVSECEIEDNHYGVKGVNSHGISVNYCVFKDLQWGIQVQDCSGFIEKDNMFENVASEVTIW
jgi:parallel beta-helix repeat protein